MLIYYEKDKRKMFVDKIASLCHQNSIIVFGKSDPIDFNIQNDLVVSNHFQSLCFDERIFSLNPTYREKVLEGYSKNNNWLEYFEFVKMSLFNRFPKNKEVEKSAIQEIISKQQDPRILIIGAGQGHQVYEIAIMIAEECAKQGKNPKDTVIIALEPITLMLVDIINGRITENDLEEIDKNLIEKYFYDKILPDGVKYKSLKQEKLPKIIARPDTYEQFAETIKKETQIETDLIFAYKIMNEIELEKLLTSKQQSLLKSLFNKHTIFISDKIICKGTSQTHKL
jgi:chemotaxis methyl-accepting protein methylase